MGNAGSELPVFVLAAFSAAWAASRAAAVVIAVWFFVRFGIGAPNAHQISLPELLFSSLFWFCSVAVFGLIVTFPAAIIAGALARGVSRITGLNWLSIHALAGFVVGTGIWFLLFRGGQPGAFLFGSSSAASLVGGSAGTIGGLTFALRMRRGTLH